MALHPEIQFLVDASRSASRVPTSEMTVAQRREQYREVAAELWPQLTPMAGVSSVTLDVSPELAARLYVPLRDEECGLLVFFHGGSFVAGDLDSHDGLCRRLATDTRMRLLSVNYRLAPELPFPAAINDAVAATRFVASHIAQFATATAKIILIGESAGAALAAAAAAATRHEGLPIAAQALLCPTVGPELITQSSHEFADGYVLEIEQLRRDYEQYVGTWSDFTDSRLSLLLNLDLTGAPPAVIVVAQFDPLRDEGVAYAGLLEHFGVTVELLEAEGMIHGFLRLGGVVPDALAIVNDLATHLHRFVEVSSS